MDEHEKFLADTRAALAAGLISQDEAVGILTSGLGQDSTQAFQALGLGREEPAPVTGTPSLGVSVENGIPSVSLRSGRADVPDTSVNLLDALGFLIPGSGSARTAATQATKRIPQILAKSTSAADRGFVEAARRGGARAVQSAQDAGVTGDRAIGRAFSEGVREGAGRGQPAGVAQILGKGKGATAVVREHPFLAGLFKVPLIGNVQRHAGRTLGRFLGF